MATLVDTSAFVALLDAEDPNHARARDALADLRPERLATHSYVVVESISLVDRRHGLAAVRDLAELFAGIEVNFVDREIHSAAMSALLARERRRLSFVDLVSFEFMRRNSIARAFAFDSDFTMQGFEVVPNRR